MASVSAKIISLQPPDKCTVNVSVSGLAYNDYSIPGEPITGFSIYNPFSSKPTYLGSIYHPATSGTFSIDNILQSSVVGKTFQFYMNVIGTNHSLPNETVGSATVKDLFIPTMPSSISYSSSLNAASGVYIKWGISTIEGGGSITYVLERSKNNASFSQCYSGTSTSYYDSGLTSSDSKVQYRVKAIYNSNASGYQTGSISSVYYNTAPSTPASISVPTPIRGGQIISISWGTASDSNLSGYQLERATNGGTFSKNETAIELQLVTPLPSDERILRAIMNVTRTIPVTSIFTVEACNNGYDTTPTWVNVTDSVLSGNKFFFANTSKTASKWGYNFKIKVQRNSASGDCYIQGIGGNFD